MSAKELKILHKMERWNMYGSTHTQLAYKKKKNEDTENMIFLQNCLTQKKYFIDVIDSV